MLRGILSSKLSGAFKGLFASSVTCVRFFVLLPPRFGILHFGDVNSPTTVPTARRKILVSSFFAEKKREKEQTSGQDPNFSKGREPNDKEVLLVLLHFHAALKITMIKDLQLLVHQR